MTNVAIPHLIALVAVFVGMWCAIWASVLCLRTPRQFWSFAAFVLALLMQMVVVGEIMFSWWMRV